MSAGAELLSGLIGIGVGALLLIGAYAFLFWVTRPR